MAKQRFYLSLGRGAKLPLYAKSTADQLQWDMWGESDMRDSYVAVILEVRADPETGEASAQFIKNKVSDQ